MSYREEMVECCGGRLITTVIVTFEAFARAKGGLRSRKLDFGFLTSCHNDSFLYLQSHHLIHNFVFLSLIYNNFELDIRLPFFFDPAASLFAIALIIFM